MDKNNSNKIISDFDQASELVLRTFPSMLKSYYDSLVKEGFSKEQAMDLTRDYQKVIFVGSSKK